MDDKTLYTKILGLKPPWFNTEVAVKEEQNRIDIWMSEAADFYNEDIFEKDEFGGWQLEFSQKPISKINVD